MSLDKKNRLTALVGSDETDCCALHAADIPASTGVGASNPAGAALAAGVLPIRPRHPSSDGTGQSTGSLPDRIGQNK